MYSFLLFYCSFCTSLFCIVPPLYCLIVLSVCCLFGEIKIDTEMVYTFVAVSVAAVANDAEDDDDDDENENDSSDPPQ